MKARPTNGVMRPGYFRCLLFTEALTRASFREPSIVWEKRFWAVGSLGQEAVRERGTQRAGPRPCPTVACCVPLGRLLCLSFPTYKTGTTLCPIQLPAGLGGLCEVLSLQ